MSLCSFLSVFSTGREALFSEGMIFLIVLVNSCSDVIALHAVSDTWGSVECQSPEYRCTIFSIKTCTYRDVDHDRYSLAKTCICAGSLVICNSAQGPQCMCVFYFGGLSWSDYYWCY